MKISLQQTRRWCAVEHSDKPSKRAIRDDILRSHNCQSGFTTLLTPMPPRDQTVFKVLGNDRLLLIGIALFYSDLNRLSSQVPPIEDGAEIFFDLHHDRLGFMQFILNGDGTASELSHLPYPEAHSTAYPLLKLRKLEVEDEEFTTATIQAWRCRWIWAWFDTAEVFRHSETVGFNICRSRPTLIEFSGWNRLTGYGGQDATTFGDLYRGAPDIELSEVSAALVDGSLRFSGKAATRLRSLKWELVNPLGESAALTSSLRQGAWSSSIPLTATPPGRYRLKVVTENLVEPSEFFFDLAETGRDFRVSMTYDTPMSVIPNYYTPDRLREEMALIARLGVDRIQWIEYGNGDDWPSFWQHERWRDNARKTFRECGNFLTTAARQAHANGMELYAVCKIFDLGFNVWYSDRKTSSTIGDIEGRYVATHPDIAAHQELTLQSNAVWRTSASFPITRIRLYSEEPIATIEARDIQLRVSQDNRNYRHYKGKIEVRQGTVQRPNYCWTPAGRIREPGAKRNWFIELSGLNIKEPFAAININGCDVTLVHRGFMVVEAEDANGNLAPLTVATKGHRDFTDPGYYFWKEWPGWANYTEPILQQRRWTGHDLGLTFQEMPNMPTLLEPSYKGARDIWLAWLQRVLDSGVDGVNIRSFCNHNGAMAWLKYAFATPVVESFEARYGRAPETTPEDYERIRRIRGDFFTQFLRDAKKLTLAHNAKLVTHLEAGIEVPPHLDTRMQLFLDYRTWIEEGIVDEVDLKGWTAHNPWVHDEVLPLARRHGVPVHIISPCLDNGFNYTAMSSTPQLLVDAYRAGFAGYNFYETDNLIELSPAGFPLAKGYTEPALLKARAELDAVMNKENG